MTRYTIHNYTTGEFLKTVNLDADDSDRLETIAGETREGVFRADRLDALAELGALSVYALIH